MSLQSRHSDRPPPPPQAPEWQQLTPQQLMQQELNGGVAAQRSSRSRPSLDLKPLATSRHLMFGLPSAPWSAPRHLRLWFRILA